MELNLEDDPFCEFDYLQIHDGPHHDSDFLGKGRICGTKRYIFPPSKSNQVYITYNTDSTVGRDTSLEAETGFRLVWTAISN